MGVWAQDVRGVHGRAMGGSRARATKGVDVPVAFAKVYFDVCPSLALDPWEGKGRDGALGAKGSGEGISLQRTWVARNEPEGEEKKSLVDFSLSRVW